MSSILYGMKEVLAEEIVENLLKTYGDQLGLDEATKAEVRADLDQAIRDFLSKGGEIKQGKVGGPTTRKQQIRSLVKNLGSSHIGKRGESPRGDKVGKGANLKGSAVAKLSGGMSAMKEIYNPLDDERREQAKMDYERSAFKAGELGHELRNEPKNNYEVVINGKVWKVFADKQKAENIARSLQRKGVNAKVHLTGARATAENAPPKAGFNPKPALIKGGDPNDPEDYKYRQFEPKGKEAKEKWAIKQAVQQANDKLKKPKPKSMDTGFYKSYLGNRPFREGGIAEALDSSADDFMHRLKQGTLKQNPKGSAAEKQILNHYLATPMVQDFNLPAKEWIYQATNWLQAVKKDLQKKYPDADLSDLSDFAQSMYEDYLARKGSLEETHSTGTTIGSAGIGGGAGLGIESSPTTKILQNRIDEFFDTSGGGDDNDELRDRVIEMYYEDGLRETEISKIEGIPEELVHRIIDRHEKGIDETIQSSQGGMGQAYRKVNTEAPLDEAPTKYIDTMRRYFAGDEEARDPTDTSIQRKFFADPKNQWQIDRSKQQKPAKKPQPIHEYSSIENVINVLPAGLDISEFYSKAYTEYLYDLYARAEKDNFLSVAKGWYDEYKQKHNMKEYKIEKRAPMLGGDIDRIEDLLYTLPKGLDFNKFVNVALKQYIYNKYSGKHWNDWKNKLRYQYWDAYQKAGKDKPQGVIGKVKGWFKEEQLDELKHDTIDSYISRQSALARGGIKEPAKKFGNVKVPAWKVAAAKVAKPGSEMSRYAKVKATLEDEAVMVNANDPGSDGWKRTESAVLKGIQNEDAYTESLYKEFLDSEYNTNPNSHIDTLKNIGEFLRTKQISADKFKPVFRRLVNKVSPTMNESTIEEVYESFKGK